MARAAARTSLSGWARRRLSASVGWLSDLRVPRPLRSPVYGAYARATGADPGEAGLPLREYPSLGAFFVRRLRAGARPIDDSPECLVSPCDGVVQALDRVRAGQLLQAKGKSYEVGELLDGALDETELDGAWAWTIYLGPRDYHRVHAPLTGELTEVRWVPGDRVSVDPRVVSRRERVFATNERAVLRLESPAGPYLLVMVGALNVGRIRVVGVDHGATPDAPRPFARGDELARFELGSTVVLIVPAGSARPLEELRPGARVRLGRPIGTLSAAGTTEVGGP